MIGAASEIKARVSMRDVLGLYGIVPNRNGRCACPFHHGTGPNMVVKERFYRCYVCGAFGTVLDFVMQYNQVSLDEAERIINDGLNLGLPIDRAVSRSEQTRLDAERSRRESEKKRIEADWKRLEKAYDQALTEWVRLDKIVSGMAPDGPLDEPEPEWVDALQRIDTAAQKLSESEEALHEFEGKYK